MPKPVWNDEWTKELKNINYDCYIRLSDCRNKFNDIIIMFELMCKYNPNKSRKECLDRITAWVCDWNSQPELFDTIYKNYDSIVE